MPEWVTMGDVLALFGKLFLIRAYMREVTRNDVYRHPSSPQSWLANKCHNPEGVNHDTNDE